MIQMRKLSKRVSASVMTGLVVAAMSVGFAYNDKTVTIVADGTSQTVKTHSSSKDGIVKDAGIILGAKDRVVVDTSSVENGSTLTVVRAVPVTVAINGKERTVQTQSKTVEDLVNELGFKGNNYTSVEDGASPIQAGMHITIVRVGHRSIGDDIESIPVEEIREKDDTMAQGEESVSQEGQPGSKIVKAEVFYDMDGKVIKRAVISETVQTEMMPRIVKEGTREVEVARGSTARASRVINMEASAYLPGDGDGLGITASGLPAVRGVVAVDTDIIPLGTRLYIPGYGEAIAADTGGAIIGNRIDLLMDDYGEAMQWGRRDVPVYILDY